MKIKPSYMIAGGLVIVVTLWMLSGLLLREPVGAKGPSTESEKEKNPLFHVYIQESLARPYQEFVKLSGIAEAGRALTLKSEIKGRIVSINAKNGARVHDGDVLVRLSDEDRHEQLQQAEALVAQRNIEHNAAKKLATKGFQSQARKAESRANLAAAQAMLAKRQLEARALHVRAPFDAVTSKTLVEIGDYVEAGDPLLEMVDLDPISVFVAINERHINDIISGISAKATLLNGIETQGVVTAISPAANQKTRTFQVEIKIDNPTHSIREGMTALVTIPTKQIEAHHISSAWLTLDPHGRIGIKSIDERHLVNFYPAHIIGDAGQGMWVAGLPEKLKIITTGHAYVNIGSAVKTTELPLDALQENQSHIENFHEPD